jgi:hypothetical protein
MAEPTRTHLWINTIIAGAAFAAATGSATVSYRTYGLSTESIGLTATFNYDCPFSFGAISGSRDKPSWQVGLCWTLTVANQSTARISVLQFLTSVESPKGTDYPVDMLTDKGVRLPSPFILDGGDARTLIARVSVSGTPLLEKTINDFVKSHPKDASYLADFAYFAAQNNLDVLGNPVEKQDLSDLIFLRFTSSYKRTVLSLRLLTGRENTFTTQLVFPRGDFDVVSPSKLRQR